MSGAAPSQPREPVRAARAGCWREAGLGLLLLLPSLVLFVMFVFYPLVKTVWLGGVRSDPFGLRQRFVGLDQYLEVLGSERFHQSLWRTVLFALYTVPLGLALGLGLAVLAHQQLKGITIFRTIFSSTVATSVAVASLMFLTLLHPSVGLVNAGLRALGHRPVAWLQDPRWALFAVSLATVWQNLGVTFLALIAGLQGVPPTSSTRAPGSMAPGPSPASPGSPCRCCRPPCCSRRWCSRSPRSSRSARSTC